MATATHIMHSQRAEIALEQAEIQLEQSSQQLKLETNRAKSGFKYASETYLTSQRNLDLAERIEYKNQVKYTEGIATSFELRQAQQQLYSAQNEYLQAMLNIITTKATLETVLNKPINR
jgi:outer membrane protein TolC